MHTEFSNLGTDTPIPLCVQYQALQAMQQQQLQKQLLSQQLLMQQQVGT